MYEMVNLIYARLCNHIALYINISYKNCFCSKLNEREEINYYWFLMTTFARFDLQVLKTDALFVSGNLSGSNPDVMSVIYA